MSLSGLNILIVYAHPSRPSYTSGIFDQLLTALAETRHSVETSDLYEMNFTSDMSEAEYKREGFADLSLAVSEDVKNEQRKIERADVVIFLYPVWWSDCPAKLKGWFDRVYSVGYAYGYDPSGQKICRMKTVPLGLVICTAGHTNDLLTETGIAQSMKAIMLDDRLGARFAEKEMIILGGTLDLENVRENHSKMINDVAARLKNYKVLN